MSLAFALAMVATVALGLWMSASGPEDTASRRLGRLRLVEEVSGPDALSEISRLHGLGPGLTGGYVATYQGAAGTAVLYVANTPSEQDAAGLLEQLERRIRAEGDRFTGQEEHAVEGVRVLSVLAEGKPQHIWRARSLVVWLAMERNYPPALTAAVDLLH